MTRLNLVTGAVGFSGMHLVKTLLERGEPVLGIDLGPALRSRRTRAIAAGIGLDFDHPGLELVAADLTDRSSLAVLRERPITHVFHTASLYDYSAPIDRLRAINVEGFENLLHALDDASLDRFVHWSTCGVFGKPRTIAEGQSNLPFNELSPSPRTTPFGEPAPEGSFLVNDYSVTKWEQEQLAWRAHREHGLPLTVLRPAPIYGPGSDYGHGGIVMTIARGCLPCIPADARNYMTVSVHVEDLARFADEISRRAEALGEDYNLVDDSVISCHEFLHYIALLLGRRIVDLPLIRVRHLKPLAVRSARTWTWLERRWNVPRVRVYEVGSVQYLASSYWISNLASKRTGFEYHWPEVRTGLRQLVEWYREVGWLP